MDRVDPEVLGTVSPSAVLAAVRRWRFGTRGQRRRCPRCGHAGTIRWGRFRDRQRYRCRACRRTFSDLTGTPLAYTKRLGSWIAFGQCMGAALSVRATGRLLGIDKDTALRWRHRLGHAWAEGVAPVLPGPVALASIILLESQKGRTPINRPPRKQRGRLATPGRTARVHVVLATSAAEVASWGFAAIPTMRFSASPDDLRGRLAPLLEPRTTIVADDWRHRDLMALATAGGHGFLTPDGRKSERWATAAVRSASAMIGPWDRVAATSVWARAIALRTQWKRWMVRFRGVASRHLPCYLAWYRELEDTGVDPPGGRAPGWSWTGVGMDAVVLRLPASWIAARLLRRAVQLTSGGLEGHIDPRSRTASRSKAGATHTSHRQKRRSKEKPP